RKAELDLELAEESLKLLLEYTYQRRIEELKSNVEQTAMALERARRKAAADVVQAEAELQAREADFNRQKSQLAKLDEQIAKARIHARTDGMVIYSTTGQGGWRGNSEPLAEGQTVRERQDLINLPTASDVMAVIKVH